MHKEETPTSSTSPQRNTAALQRIINCTDFIWQSATCCFVELCVVDCWLPDTSLVAGLEEYEERGRGEPAAGWRGRRPTTQHGPGRTLNINRRTHVGATRLIWITGHMCHTCGQMLEGEWFTWGGGGWSTVHAASMTRVPTVWWSPAHVTVTVLITVTHLKQTHTHTYTQRVSFWLLAPSVDIAEQHRTHPMTVAFPATVVNTQHWHILTLLVQTHLKKKKKNTDFFF